MCYELERTRIQSNRFKLYYALNKYLHIYIKLAATYRVKIHKNGIMHNAHFDNVR